MQELLFLIFAAITVIPAVMLVASRNSVNSAMLMILSFVGTAALFALLEAYLLAVLQIIVYVGAVVVLFLFIAMLVGSGSQKLARRDFRNIAFALAAFVALSACSLAAIASGRGGQMPVAGAEAPASSASGFGFILFTKYQLPFEITGFLLLAAMVGVIWISRRQKAPDSPAEAE
ncbi:MAG TPA: NADH-quinone oxidoreductase subunit J [Opitutales bacterium]|nr:NADH-quinone oxidoreductase subunit J [Opitutales bacterium]